MAANAESQWEIDGTANADANGDENLVGLEAVVEHLKRRLRIEEIEAIVLISRETQRLAKATWTRGELAGFSTGAETAIARHLFQA